MPMKKSHAMIAAALTLVSLPVGLAASKVVPDQMAAPLPRGFAATGRPMDDLGVPVDYGDLSVFDTVEQLGISQDVNVPYCDRRPQLTATLNQDFAERKKVAVPLEQGRSVELWASEIMGTWTAVYTRADNVSCVVSSGIGWKSGASPVALLEAERVLPAG